MRILSGIQPTGPSYHVGNYLGAIKQWVEMQETADCLFCIVDLHAITVPQDPKTLAKSTLEKTAELLALGIDPDRCTLFAQSYVKEHTELSWIFSTITPVGELERMTQYKDKAKKQRENANAGLLTYPILMAADILLYKPDVVPVGEDQKQHLELTRAIARKFNARFGKTFAEPAALIPKTGGRIMSLQDPKKKMSKSDPADTQISLFDSPEAIRKKIKIAVTDTGKDIKYSQTKKPGISNLLLLYSLFSGTTISEAETYFKGKGYAVLKKELADVLIETLEPFRVKKHSLISRDVYLREVLLRGAKKARSLAEQTMEEVRAKVGLLS
ncbi:MAG: tryptophan--tRNA ligase [Candidatus Yanofskybacteria bacterium]|nr:tryptophan--tRNA ligase [Candidatus Yanofskybacteria bacterium]